MVTFDEDLTFAFGQFSVCDAATGDRGLRWSSDHSAQGFTRREDAVAFATLLESGTARVTIHTAEYRQDSTYERVIAVPFQVSSGRVRIKGPDDELNLDRTTDLAPGHYRLVAAQRVEDDFEETIDLFFQRLSHPLNRSQILVADRSLKPPPRLLEDASPPSSS